MKVNSLLAGLKIIITVILLFVFHHCSSSQSPDWEFQFFGRDIIGVSGDINTVVEDSRGVMWFGTENKGLLTYDGLRWKPITHIPGDTFGLSSNKILCLVAGKNSGEIYTCTSNGISVFENGTWKLNLLTGSQVLSMLYTPKGDIWAGTTNGLVQLEGTSGDSLWYFCPPSPSIPKTRNENAFHCLLLDPQNSNLLWVGSENGLKSFDIGSKTFTHHYNLPKWHNRLPEYQQFNIRELAFVGDTLYLGAAGSGGILAYQNNQWDQFLFNGGDPKAPYYGNYVTSICFVSRELFLVGTRTLLGRVNFQNGQIESLWHPQVSPLGRVLDIANARNSAIWLAGTKGVIKARAPTYKGELYRPVIGRIQVDGEDIPFLGDTVLHLNAGTNLSISFYSPNPVKPESIVYKYMLVGLDTTWNETAVGGVAQYNDLPRGIFNFQFEVVDTANLDFARGRNFAISSEKQWFQKPGIIVLLWFALFLILFVLVRFFSKMSERRTERKTALEKRAISAELTAMRSQMNPHFIFNSLNAIHHYILNSETERAADYLAKFAALMRGVLAQSKTRVISLQGEVETLEIYIQLEQIRFQKSFTYSLIVDPALKIDAIFIPPLLIQPYLESLLSDAAIRSGEGLSLQIHIQTLDDMVIVVTIEARHDSMPGMKPGLLSDTTPDKMQMLEERLKSLSILHKVNYYKEEVDLSSKEEINTGRRIVLYIPVLDASSLSK